MDILMGDPVYLCKNMEVTPKLCGAVIKDRDENEKKY